MTHEDYLALALLEKIETTAEKEEAMEEGKVVRKEEIDENEIKGSRRSTRCELAKKMVQFEKKGKTQEKKKRKKTRKKKRKMIHRRNMMIMQGVSPCPETREGRKRGMACSWRETLSWVPGADPFM